MNEPERNGDTPRRFIEAVWNQGDSEAADRYLAPRYTIHHDPGDPWDGRELDLAGFKERARISRAPFPDQRFTIRDLTAQGDRVIIAWHWQATHLGEFPGFPATGQTLRMSGATVYHFEGGRITGHWQVTDRLGVYLQLQQAAAEK